MERVPRVALVHGQRRIVAFLELELLKFGFAVDSAENADEAFRLITKGQPDVVVLDPKTPGLDGLALLRLLRQNTQAPIVMLGVGFERSEQLACLESGADYCLNLPADIKELTAIIRAALRRPQVRDANVCVVGDIEVDFARRTVLRSGRKIALTRKEFDILSVLVREPYHVFSRQDLLALAWRSKRDVSEHAVDTSILGLRKKLDAPFGVPTLHTIRGIGFTLRPTSTDR